MIAGWGIGFIWNCTSKLLVRMLRFSVGQEMVVLLILKGVCFERLLGVL